MEREEYNENKKVRNIEEKVFVIFEIYPKQSKKERKLIPINY